MRPPGELAGWPTPLDVADVLNKVPPHLLGDQIVSEAQRLAGVTSVALYLVDISGTLLLRLAGSEEFPSELDAPLAVGPEIPREGLPRLRTLIEDELPGSVMAPLAQDHERHAIEVGVIADDEILRHPGLSLHGDPPPPLVVGRVAQPVGEPVVARGPQNARAKP